MPRTARPLITLLAALAALSLPVGPALAQYPPQAGEVIDADIVVENPDATVEIEGRDWSGDTVVEITVDGDGQVQQIGQVRTDEDGSFQAQVTLPEGVDPDEVTLTVAEQAVGAAEGARDSQTFTLADADTTPTAAGESTQPEALAATGGLPTDALGLALALLTAGVGAVAAARWWGRRLDTER